MGRMTAGAVGPRVPGQVELLHTFLPAPLPAPSLISRCNFLAGDPSPDSGSRNTPEESGASSSQRRDGHGVRQRVPLHPWDAGCRGAGCERLP